MKYNWIKNDHEAIIYLVIVISHQLIVVVTQFLISYLIKTILKDFIQTYTTFPLLSEDGVRKMVIVVAVTSSSFTQRGRGGGGARNKMFTRNNNLTLDASRKKGEKSS